MLDLGTIRALVLDIDGVLYEGERALPCAVDLIENLNARHTPYVLLSNNTTRTLDEHVDKLSRLGMPIPPESFVTAARVTARVLARESRPGARCLVIGEAGLIEAMGLAGFEVTQTDARDVDYVVIGMDRQLTYDKLKAATAAIRNGARFISSNPDPIYPNGDELIPASGAIQAALEAATGIPARVTGKPETPAFHVALDMLGTEATQTAMLGDQLGTDILGAYRAGLKSILLLSAITPTYAPEEAVVQPDLVFHSTADFYHAWVKR